MILLGDCLERLKELEDNSVDACITDPPYALTPSKGAKGGFMGKTWDAEVPSVEIWREVFRVLKPGAHLLSFGGPRTYHHMAMNVELAGFEIRDQLQWLYGSGFPKSHNGDHGGTALKPANEPIVLARKPLSEKTVALNFAKWGVGGLNIDESRIVGADQSSYAKNWDRNTVPDIRGGNYSNDNGARVPNSKDAPQGRWPANLLLDESAAEMLDEQTVNLGSGGSKRNSKTSELHGWTGTDNDRIKDSGGASRFFYVAKVSKRERNAGLEGEVKQKQGARPNSADSSGKFPDHDHRETGGNNHPTVKPIKLMEYLCKLITPAGGTILDPFMGSGSTGVAAHRLGFKFIGIEMNEEYCEIARRRIENE